MPNTSIKDETMFSSIQCRLAFQFLPLVGPAVYWKCTEHFGSIEPAFNQYLDRFSAELPDEAAAVLRGYAKTGKNSALYKSVLSEQERCDAAGITLLSEADGNYPMLLREIPRCPPILYVRGDVSALSLPQIAIVGSRSPSPIGQEIAREFAQGLAQHGFVVTSGLALGVDACAHRGALTASAPFSRTVAVLGSGLNMVYPKRNRGLAEQIINEGGALVSEFALDSSAKREHFPQRNRIVSGLSLGALVVEAALKSGSLITARHALEQNREVFAIPGSIRNPASKGCHALIKSGAKLVESIEDIVAELGSILDLQKQQLTHCERASTVQSAVAELPPSQRKILSYLGFEPTSVDRLEARSGIKLDSLLSSLLELELGGYVENTGMGYLRVKDL